MITKATVSFSGVAIAVFALSVALSAKNVIADETVDGASGTDNAVAPIQKESTLQLGSFSNSLAVKDIEASREFYEKLGFEVAGGNIEQNWLILRNDTTTIGLFQGMLEQNIMTFNPGWNEIAEPLEIFEDVRELQSKLKQRGVKLTAEAASDENGPASFMLADPDGNVILIDQHVPKAN